MAGSGFKDFTTGEVLTANDVDNYLMQQTVMVFASSAARTTALASVLAEGMISYLKDTNSTEYYSGSAWVAISGGAGGSGLTLVSPSSIAFTGTSASTSAGKTVFSNVSSLSLNGIFTSTYENYIVLFSDLVQSANSPMTFYRYRAGGTDTTSGYTTIAGYQMAGSALQFNPDVTDKHNCFQVDTTRSMARFEICNPQTATATTMVSEFQTSNYNYTKGRQSGTTQFDGMTIFNASVTFTGTVRVYGLQN
jgi:hypothetical protein